ncbi:MAG: aldolase [Proteobacteria bacterium]|nr:aldolase [Pseudomonadota bacterium]
MTDANRRNFRQRLVNGDLLIGTWVKTPSPIVCEVLGKSDLDALCLDAEHAPFGRAELDACIAATRAANMTPLVRVPSADPHNILNALDCGAAGIVVPHVRTVEDAEAICQRSLYGPGGRGFAGSSRAAGFAGKAIADQLRESAEQTTIIAQIEDVDALNVIDEIAAVERLDCLFIGRIDLTVALGKTDPNDPEIIDAVASICAAGQKANIAVGMFVTDVAEVRQWQDLGASLFLLQSDQAFLLAGAAKLAAAFR